VGAQVTNSAALQQQQLVATSASSVGAVGMPGMTSNHYLGMTNPLQQQQMQFQLLQQQQQQQQMMMGGYHQPVTHTMAMGAASGGAGSVQRIKTEELVSSLQALLAEYEKHSSSGSSSGGSSADVAAAKVNIRLYYTLLLFYTYTMSVYTKCITLNSLHACFI